MTYREPKVAEYWWLGGDVHAASDVAPFPEKVSVDIMSGGVRTITPNPVQRKLNRVWNGMMDNLPYLTGALLNGDLCDGPNRKNGGRGVCTTDLGAQVSAAVDLIRPLKRRLKYPGNIFGTLGSEYHTVDDRPLDRAVTEELGGYYQAEQIIPMLQGDFRVQAHHVINGGTSGNFTYLPTAPARDHMVISLHNGLDEYGDVQWVVRSHRHQYTEGNFGASRGYVVLPGWQGKTEYVVRRGGVSVPKLGYCILKIFEDGTAHIVPYLFNPIKPCKDAPVAYDTGGEDE